MANEQERRATILNLLRAGNSAKDIIQRTKIPKSTVYDIQKAWKQNKYANTSARVQHKVRSDRTGKNVIKKIKKLIDKNPTRSMRSVGRDIGYSHTTVRKIIKEEFGYNSYSYRTGQFLSEATKKRRLEKAKKLLIRIKHPQHPNQLIFFSDEKNFNQDQKINRKNDRYLCASREEVPIVMSTKFPVHIMVLGVVSNEGDVMPPHIFEQGLKVNADVYLKVLKDKVVPWMKKIAAGRHFIFQQDGAPAHNAKKTQEWLKNNVPEFWPKEYWPPSSPDLNPLDYYVWGIVEKDTNKKPHNTIKSVIKCIKSVMKSMDRSALQRACAAFRSRLETTIAGNGDFFEQK